MRLCVPLILMMVQLGFGQTNHSDVFLQDVATVFTTEDGLPDLVIQRIVFSDDGKPIAVSAEGSAILDNNKWIYIYDISSPLNRIILDECDYENEYQNIL